MPVDTPDTITLALCTPSEVLLLQRNPEPQIDYIDPQGGMWKLIGGHIHEGESSIDATHRETREETGIVGLQLHYIATLPFKCKGVQAANWVYAAFSIERVGVTLSNEHVNYQWVPITEVMHATLAYRHAEIVQMVHERMSELHL
jgi:8-oxo-dGTP pyrophosphatase MutT (NUDIX family)